MSEFYLEMRDIASDLLSDFKQGLIRYIAVTPGAGPADNPGPPIETPYTLDATARGVSFKYVNNTSIVVTDGQVTMAYRPDVTPDIKGFIEGDGVRHKVVAVVRIPEFGDVVAWRIIFKR
jgi:hypothetical protein